MPEGYEFSGLNHVTVTVKDMEQSLHFYRDVIGFKVTMDVGASHDREGMNLAHRAPREGHRMVTFDTGGGPTVSLTEYKEGEGEGILLDDIGVTHFSVTVSDLQALTKRVLAEGFESTRPGFFTDPDGILIQFQEPSHSESVRAHYQAKAQSG